MRIADVDTYVDHFAKRVIQDAYAQASATYWRRRAVAFEAALPQPGDYLGQATSADLETRRERIGATIAACYTRAGFSPGGEVE